MEVKELIELKTKLIEEIYENTQNQMLVASKEEEEELLKKLIVSRAGLISQLEEANRNLADFELSEELSKLDKILNDKIKEIIKNDAQIFKIINDRGLEVSNKLKNMKKARNVVTKGYMNYAGSEQQPAYYIDKKK